MPSGDLVIRDPWVLCHRCDTQVARTRGTPDDAWPGVFPSPRLLGSGWHIGRDEVWRPESKVSSRAREGKEPLASHHRAVMTVQVDKIGLDPVTGKPTLIGETVVYKTEPRGVEGYVAPGRLVECPKCGAVSRYNPPGK